jgi:DNA helicase-2/ATP-dependent DNA helicase PcrA
MTAQLRDDFPPHLQGLNSPQLEAVRHFEGPILVLAGAGSGKTRVLTRRIAHLVLHHKVAPWSIMAVTFTNKAAGEMRQRLGGLLGDRAEKAWVSTFHSASLRILRRHGALLDYQADFGVYDSNDSLNTMGKVLKARAIDIKKYPPRNFLKQVERFKNEYIGCAQALADARGSKQSELAEIYSDYQKELKLANAMDFGDLLFNAVCLFEGHRDVLDLYRQSFRFLLVDEFQDTNPIQYRLLKLLTATHKNLLVVGDDDQSIYAFRGANPQNMVNFRRDFSNVKVVKLEENYRSTQVILDVAHSIIQNNTERMEKRLWTQSEGGSPVVTYVASNESEEAQFILGEIRARLQQGVSEGDIAVFYRTNAQSRALEEAFVASGLSYRIYGGLRFYDRKEVKDIISFLRLLINPRDLQALLRTINTPPRGIGPKSIQVLLEQLPAFGGDIHLALDALASEHRSLGVFARLLRDFKGKLGELSLGGLVEYITVNSGYIKRLEELKDYTAQSRIENLRELQGLASDMERYADDTLEQLRVFLDRAALMSSADLEEADAQAPKECISLMTLHLAKGLEFDTVFFTGLEDGLLPHYLSAEEPEAVEEERRLVYVGVTRARRKLYLTRARSRILFGGRGGVRPEERFRSASPFLAEIPENLLDQRKGEMASSRVYEEVPGYSVGMTVKMSPPSTAKRHVLDMLRPADTLGSVALLEELSVGIKVRHPFFGSGTVEAIDINESTPENSKIEVAFDDIKASKRLIYKLARLELMQSI